MVCLGFEPGGCKLVGTDETTELWRPSRSNKCLCRILHVGDWGQIKFYSMGPGGHNSCLLIIPSQRWLASV